MTTDKMMKPLVHFVAFVLMLNVVSAGRSAGQRASKYRYFDEYLISVTQPRQQNQVLKDEGDQIAEPAVTEDAAGAIVQDSDILGYFRDVPRAHWSCCMLGKLAGDKGFHCQANFYATRIARRNVNRAQTQRMLFHGPNPIVNWGRDIMTTFSRCIQEHAIQFHDCCYATTLERRERRRWQLYRDIEEELPDS